MKKKIILAGGGGHAKVVIDAINKMGTYTICGIVDIRMKKGERVSGVPVVGDDDAFKTIFKKKVRHAFIGIGSIGNCDARKKVYGNLRSIGFQLPIIAHPSAVVAHDVEIGEGTFIAAGAVINPGAKIGKNAIINTSASIDHDCVIGNFVHVAPGAVLSGGVTVGDETHIGTGASVIQGTSIGKKCFISAGMTVCEDMSDGAKLSRRFRQPDDKE